MGRLWGWQGIEVLWTKETTLGGVWQLTEHFRGDVVPQDVVFTGEHLHRVLRREFGMKIGRELICIFDLPQALLFFLSIPQPLIERHSSDGT